jgi:methylase of polypeptide subunit release factors
MTPATHLDWTRADGQTVHALWHAQTGAAVPRRWQLADDRTPADLAYRLACEGTALIWQGDFQNARHLLQALTRRLERKAGRSGAKKAETPALAFHQHRQRQAQRAAVLGQLLIPLEADHGIDLRRAPDVRQACLEAWGPGCEPGLVSLRELLGLIGAHEWRKKGVPIAALQGRSIHPHHGVFSPVRGEYIDLVAKAPLPASTLAFDIGVGTGVLSAVLASRGVQHIVATDQDPRALACAHDNLQRLGLVARVELLAADLFPPGRAPLVVCNPPWVPARPSSPIEHAVYDPDSRMLRGFLQGLAAHLTPGGEGWLILSDLAEHLGLRSREALQGWIDAAGLQVLGRLEARPRHPKASDPTDPLHQARAAERTHLWRLGVRDASAPAA